jgi:uncharacterized protein YunC (DUF1805 family)
MICTEFVKIASKSYTYVKIEMSEAPLVLLRGEKGFVMCGYLNLEAAEKLNDIAVRVTGVKDLESLLNAKVAGITTGAKGLGIKEGDKISDIIYLL